MKNERTTHILQGNLKRHRNSMRRRTRSEFWPLRQHRIGATYRLPMRSTYGWEPPWAASTPLPFSLLYMPRDTPFVIAFISVYTDADVQGISAEASAHAQPKGCASSGETRTHTYTQSLLALETQPLSHHEGPCHHDRSAVHDCKFLHENLHSDMAPYALL